VHFVNPQELQPEYTPLVLPETTVMATTTAERYLGFSLDPRLEFHHHRERAVAKAGTSLQALRGLAGSTWGAWEAIWASERTSGPTRRLIEAPTKKVLEYWSGLRKATLSVMLQLRSGRIALAAYLHKINRRESARCACDLGNQTIGHVLLQCPLLNDQRESMRSALAERGVSMAIGVDELLRQKAAAPAVAKFMIDSGLLEQFQAVDFVATGVEETGEGDKEV
jgi:hypothetical protein